METKGDVLAIGILCLILLVYLAIRFDPTITFDVSTDISHYVGMVQINRKETPDIYPQPPFVYRVLVPFLAAQLPFDAPAAIIVVNGMALIIGTIFIYLIMGQYAFPVLLKFTGGLLFVLSPAHFNFAASPLVDATLNGFLCAGLYFILVKRYCYVALIIVVGCLVKETMIILLPVWAVHLWIEDRRRMYIVTGAAILAIAILVIVRLESGAPGYIWQPRIVRIQSNLAIGHTANVMFVFGITGLLAIPQLLKRKNAVLTTGYIMAILLTVYAATSAWLDGRHIWTIYPFAVPLATMTQQDWITARKI